MENGLVMASETISWHRSLKDAKNVCKENHYSWPYYYILRKNSQGELMYKP